MIPLLFAPLLYASPPSDFSPSSTALTPELIREIEELAPLLENMELLREYELLKDMEFLETIEDPDELEEP
jgi:hypothetical protein